MKAWFRALIRWLDGGDWSCPDEDHYCGACAIGQALADHFDAIPATVRLGHEALPLRPEDRDAEIQRLEEWVGR